MRADRVLEINNMIFYSPKNDDFLFDGGIYTLFVSVKGLPYTMVHLVNQQHDSQQSCYQNEESYQIFGVDYKNKKNEDRNPSICIGLLFRMDDGGAADMSFFFATLLCAYKYRFFIGDVLYFNVSEIYC